MTSLMKSCFLIKSQEVTLLMKSYFVIKSYLVMKSYFVDEK